MSKFFQLFDLSQKVNYKTEVLSGLTVAIALVPEAIAFAMIAGLSPLTGLYAAFSIGLVTSIFGGRPGMISGATGAIAVVFVGMILEIRENLGDLSADEIVQYVFATVILAGLIQIVIGILRLGKFIRLVPHSVMFGFVNGLAIVIFMSQLDQFKIKLPDGTMEWMTGATLLIMLGLVLLTMLIIWGLPKFTKAVPSGLVAILVIAGITIGFGVETSTVLDTLDGGTMAAGLPIPTIPSLPFTWETLTFILPYAIIVASVGLIESLLTLNLIDEITQTRGRGNKECVAQGTANIVTGFLTGMGGCAMIGQSLINISSGARARLSGIVASVMLLMFILFGAPVIEQLPMAALTGLMIMVSIGTFEWASLKVFNKMPKIDVLVMLVVMLVTVVFHNLALAVFIGVIISALAFAWENAMRIRARKYIDEAGVKHYQIYGPLFFGSVSAFLEKFDVENDPAEIVIDFKESRVTDMSAIEALNKITELYHKANKRVTLRHLSPDCRTLLKNAEKIIDINVDEDPTYRVMADEMG
jgi:sulfate permease, SulP family